MSGTDEKSSNPEKPTAPSREPPTPMYETTDFSVSTDQGLTDKLENPIDDIQLPVDAYATQVTQQPSTEGGSQVAGGIPAPSAGDKLEFPTDIPGFVVESELGRGAFGVVYCARDELLDRRVAIKKPLISNPAHRKQYIDEARKAVKLDHPGIVPIFQVGMTGSDEPFVVQKLIEGSTLRHMLQAGEGRISLGQTISIMRQVCLAVDAAHTAGIVHRDLKPENLLVEPDGRVYVADFGLAILEDDESNKKGREVAGTPLYMSPEQFAGRVEWLDGRSDIWALGVILYELVSGKTPFTGKTLSELRDQIKNKDPRPIHQRDPKIPAGFDAVFRKCCAKNVAERYASTREMLAELESISESHRDTIAWDSRSRSSMQSTSFGTEAGSMMNASQTWLESLGFSTQRKTQSTIRSSMVGATIRQPNVVWSLLGPIVTTVVTLLALTSIAYYLKWGPFASLAHNETPRISIPNIGDDINSIGKPNSPLNIPPTTPSIDPKVDVPIVPRGKPYVVSNDGSGSHDSIAKAIADSDAGDTITILAGTYRESIEIDRSITIVGKDSGKLKATIIGTSNACIRIKADSIVEIENVAIDCQAPEFNSIDMNGGTLWLKKCEIFASSAKSYDCVKARENSSFTADACKFQSTMDVAISAEKTSSITVRSSEFSFSGVSNASSVKKRVGIQGTGALGAIRDCTFLGPCRAGIDWKESLEPIENLTVESCQFMDCDVGIQTNNCKSVSIKGTEDKPCKIENAAWGVSIVRSTVDLDWLKIEGTSDKNKVGLQVTEESTVNNIANCEFRGMSCGMLLNRSSATVGNLQIRDTGFAGMLVDGGTIVGGSVKLSRVSNYGLIVLGKNVDVFLDSLTVDAARRVGVKDTPAIYATSGRVEFKEGIFSECNTGIFIDPNRVVINMTGPDTTKNFAELMGKSDKNEASMPLVEVDGARMVITNCGYGWLFAGSGRSRVHETSGTPESELVMSTANVLVDKTDLTNITATERK